MGRIWEYQSKKKKKHICIGENLKLLLFSSVTVKEPVFKVLMSTEKVEQLFSNSVVVSR